MHAGGHHLRHTGQAVLGEVDRVLLQGSGGRGPVGAADPTCADPVRTAEGNADVCRVGARRDRRVDLCCGALGCHRVRGEGEDPQFRGRQAGQDHRPQAGAPVRRGWGHPGGHAAPSSSEGAIGARQEIVLAGRWAGGAAGHHRHAADRVGRAIASAHGEPAACPHSAGHRFLDRRDRSRGQARPGPCAVRRDRVRRHRAGNPRAGRHRGTRRWGRRSGCHPAQQRYAEAPRRQEGGPGAPSAQGWRRQRLA